MSSISQRERDKYDLMWAVPQYREFSPGQKWIPTFLALVGESRGSLLDIGCGTGMAGQTLKQHGFDVTGCDTARVCDADIPFFEVSLWRLQTADPYDYGYCCDVMEHIPREFTMLTLDRILSSCRTVFFTIATEPDAFGVRIGEQLHLTVEPFVWWRDRLRELGTVLDARDCLNTAVFLVARDAN